MVELAEAVEAGRVHMVSSIAAAGLYKGTWREDMFEEAENLDNHPYFRTKHDSEAVVRTECIAAVAGLPAGDRRRPLGDRRDGQDRRPLLLLQADPQASQRGPPVDTDDRCRGQGDQPRSRGLRGAGHGPHRPPRWARRPGLPPDRPEPEDGRRGDRHLRPRGARPAVLRPRPAGRGRSPRAPAQGPRDAAAAGLVADSVLSDFGIPRSVLTYVNYPTSFDSRQAQAALSGTDIRVPPLQAYADKLWDYWERHLDPDLFRDRTLVGAVRGRAGAVGGATQVIEQQIPDELLRLARRVLGTVLSSRPSEGAWSWSRARRPESVARRP